MHGKRWIVAAAGCAVIVGLGAWFNHEVDEAIYDDPKTVVFSRSLAAARTQHTLVSTPALVDSSVEWQGRRYPIVETWIEREVKHERQTGRYFMLLRLGADVSGDSLSFGDLLSSFMGLEYAPRQLFSSEMHSLWLTSLTQPFPDTLRLRVVPF
jgi:hypothetical protein